MGLIILNTNFKNMIRQIRRTIDYLEHLPITLLSIDNVEIQDDIISIHIQTSFN